MTKDSFLRAMARVALDSGHPGYASRAWSRLNDRLAEKSRDKERRKARREKGWRLVQDILCELRIERILREAYASHVIASVL